MYENIDEKKLQEVINSIVEENASIGVHGIALFNQDKEDKNIDPKEILTSIMSEGLRMSTNHGGLTGTIKFLDKEECASDILEYMSYQSEDENGVMYRIICAIPEVMEDKDGKKYYLGKYDKVPQLGKDNYKVHYLPTHDLTLLPKELIVGYLAQNLSTNKSTFVLNNNYYNIQNEEVKKDFEDSFLQKLKSNANGNLFSLLSQDEKSYEAITRLYKIYSKIGLKIPNEYYLKSFIESYNKQGKTK